MLTCPVCPERTFGSVRALHQHQNDSKNHYYCRSCTTAFRDRDELFDHAANVHSTTCGSCRRMFASEKGVQRHFLDSPKHPKCWPCQTGFRDYASLNSHKAEVHGSSRTRRRTSRKKRRQRSFSPAASSTDHSSASTLLLLSPSSSAVSQISDRNSMIQEEVTALRHRADDVSTVINPSTQLSGVPCRPNSSLSSAQSTTERRGASPTTSNHESSEDRARSRRAPPPEHGEELQSRSPAAFLGFRAKPSDISQTAEAAKSSPASPLPEMSSPLQLYSDSSSDDGVTSGHLSPVSSLDGNPPYHRVSPQSHQGTLRSENEDILSLSLPWGKTNPQGATSSPGGIVDTMRAACRARSAGVARPASPLRLNSPSRVKTLGVFPWLSRLPTILDETETEQVLDVDNYSEALEEPTVETPPEKWDLSRPAGRRKRRLSLSPTLPSIPEAMHIHEVGSAPQVDQGDSDSDSSQGIYEHRGEDFLYDSLSENERCQTPMTYLTADELDFDIDAKRDADYSIFLVEDLTRLTEELSSSSVTDNTSFDPSADPFELHPSANNSPMSATFPKRPRAWSLSDTTYDSRYLSPERSSRGSEDNGSKGEEEKPNSGANAGENEVDAEPNEAAITADEPAPRIIEEDLFSESDETMGPMPIAMDSIIEGDAGEARFAEEGHPLRSLISLDTLPFRAEGPNSSENVEPSAVSQPQGERHNHLSEAVVGRSVLRCRVCQSDPCKDVTATFCGHIFCNECITREVTAKSKCPVCNVPTLLYCLFKLDLSL